MNYDLFGMETKYLKWYKLLIENPSGIVSKYYENHHIFPKSIFGENNAIIKLSYREHFLAHMMLWKHFKKINGVHHHTTKKMALAFSYMGFANSKKIISKHFSILKIAAHEANAGKNNSFFGRTHSEDARKIISDKAKGRTHTLEAKSKISEHSCISSQNRIFMFNEITKHVVRPIKESDEYNAYNANGYSIGFYCTDEERLKRGAGGIKMVGVPKSTDHKLKLSNFKWMINNLGLKVKVKKENIPDAIAGGFTFGCYFNNPGDRAAKISMALTGHKKSKEWIDKINRNPEKIKKTAEKHRGMKRSDETRKKISESKSGKPSSIKKGSRRFRHNETNTEHYFLPSEVPDGYELVINELLFFHDPITMINKRYKNGEQPDDWIRGRAKSNKH